MQSFKSYPPVRLVYFVARNIFELLIVCFAGSYCVGGRVAGPCTAGFICYSGSNTPTPDGTDIVMGEPCPIGYYCLEGATNVSVCSPGQVITEPGAKSSAECTQCPAGYICTVDSTRAEPCTPGN